MRPHVLSAALALLAVAPAHAATQPPQRVYVGAYLTDVSDFDLKAGRFKADLRVWLKWLGSEEVPALTFENAEIDSKDELGRESDGAWRSVQYRVQGTFRGDFPVNAFPFDRQTLPVVFGLEQAGSQLVPDLGASGMSPHFSVTGWLYEPYFNARAERRTYGSDLGSISNEGAVTELPRVSFTVELRRPIAPYMLKFVLPLALILLMALMALFLPPETLEVRSAMGVTSLLSCIAFHYSQSDTLPNVSYLVTADLLFLGAYSFVTATLVVSVLTFRLHPRRPALAARADRAGLVGLPVVSAALLLVMVWTAGPRTAAAAVAPVRASQPLLRVGASSLETLFSSGGPSRRSLAVVRGADGTTTANLVEAAPSMTNDLVRLLPNGGMRVRWRLGPDARWSDGQRVTPDDLVFSVTTTVNPLRTAVEVVDERTIDVTYSQRRKQFIESLTLFPRAAVEPAFADGGRDAMNRAAVEAGAPTASAYRVKRFEAGQSLLLERNPRFSGPSPTFEAVEVVKVDPAAAATALLERRVDVLPVVDAVTYAALKDDARVRVLRQPGDLLYVLVPNVDGPPWNAVAARKALLAAIDRDALAEVFAPEPAEAASSWRSGFQPPAAPRYEPAAAAAALAALGLAGHPLQLHVGSLKVKDGALARMTERVRADLTRAGLQVEVIEHLETGPLLQKRAFEGLLFVGRDTSDPARFLNVPTQGGHADVEHPHGDFFDAAMLGAWDRFSGSLYDERRSSLEESLQRLWVERLPMLPLVLTSRVAAVRADLAGPDWGSADSLYWNVGDWRLEEPAPSSPVHGPK